jgi:hypothetical protein
MAQNTTSAAAPTTTTSVAAPTEATASTRTCSGYGSACDTDSVKRARHQQHQQQLLLRQPRHLPRHRHLREQQQQHVPASIATSCSADILPALPSCPCKFSSPLVAKRKASVSRRFRRRRLHKLAILRPFDSGGSKFLNPPGDVREPRLPRLGSYVHRHTASRTRQCLLRTRFSSFPLSRFWVQ